MRGTSTPLVSVLLPVRDASRTVAACLASLAAQTLEDHEVIAVDDHSIDGSAAILEETARRDHRVRVLHAARSGLVAALNTALAEARAPLVARMDADDLALPERLAIQSQRLVEDRETHVLGCRVRVLGGESNHGMRAYVDWQNELLDHAAVVRDLWVESPLVHPSVLMRRDALHALGGYREFDGPEDYDLWLRAYAGGLRFAKVPETLLLWRDHPHRLTRTDPRYAAGRFRALKIASLEAGPLHAGREVVVWGAGPIGKSWSSDLQRRSHRVAAFVEVDPGKIGQVIHGAPVVALTDAGWFRGPLHLAAVGQLGARERIRSEVRRLGLERDLFAVA